MKEYKIKTVPKPTAKVTLRDYYNAVYYAQDLERPNRYNLLEIYDDIITDPILGYAIDTRRLKVTGLQYTLTKDSGKVDKQATNLFYKTWFKRLLRYIIDARLFGNSVVDISIENGEIIPYLIPRVNIIPEKQMIKSMPFDYIGNLFYGNRVAYPNMIDINNNYESNDLGELLKVAKYVLIKNELIINWTQYTEIFGQPLRVVTTDSDSANELNVIEANLKAMGRSGYMMKNSQTDIKFESASTSSSDTFGALNTVIDNAINIAILGSTVTTQNYSEADSQERGSNLITKEDIVFVETYINDYVLPILKNNGMISTQVKNFSFDEPEILTTEQKIAVDTFLLQHFEVDDIQGFESRYGRKLKPKKEKEDETTTEDPIKETEDEVD